MKKYISVSLIAVLTAIMLLTFGCKKTTSTTTSDVFVGFHFHTFIGGNLVDPYLYPTQSFPDSNGRIMHLGFAQFYITNISVHILNGAWQPLSGLVALKRINNEIYPLGNIASGIMDSVKFTVGLGNALNTQQSNYSASNPLDSVLSASYEPSMDSSGMAGMSTMPSGFTFVSIQGYDSTDHIPFNYQIGGYGDTVNIVLNLPGGFSFSPVLTGGGLNLIHIIADYGKLLESIPAMTPANTNSTFYGPNPTPSNTLLNNIKNMFRWECTPPINC